MGQFISPALDLLLLVAIFALTKIVETLLPQVYQKIGKEYKLIFLFAVVICAFSGYYILKITDPDFNKKSEEINAAVTNAGIAVVKDYKVDPNARPSFSCANISTVTERFICSDREIADEERKMVNAYRGALNRVQGNEKQVSSIKSSQVDFRKRVRETILDKEVYISLYKSRASELEAVNFEKPPEVVVATPEPVANGATFSSFYASSVSLYFSETQAVCLRYDNRWLRMADGLTLRQCIKLLYDGRCVSSGMASYGRWGDYTVRLVPKRVEISKDNTTFSGLVAQQPPCVIPVDRTSEPANAVDR